MPGYEDHGPRIGGLVNANYIPHFLEVADDFEDDVVLLLDQKRSILNGSIVTLSSTEPLPTRKNGQLGFDSARCDMFHSRIWHLDQEVERLWGARTSLAICGLCRRRTRTLASMRSALTSRSCARREPRSTRQRS